MFHEESTSWLTETGEHLTVTQESTKVSQEKLQVETNRYIRNSQSFGSRTSVWGGPGSKIMGRQAILRDTDCIQGMNLQVHRKQKWGIKDMPWTSPVWQGMTEVFQIRLPGLFQRMLVRALHLWKGHSPKGVVYMCVLIWCGIWAQMFQLIWSQMSIENYCLQGKLPF